MQEPGKKLYLLTCNLSSKLSSQPDLPQHDNHMHKLICICQIFYLDRSVDKINNSFGNKISDIITISTDGVVADVLGDGLHLKLETVLLCITFPRHMAGQHKKWSDKKY